MLLNRTTFEHHQKKVPIKQALQEALKLNHQMAELTKTSGASPEDLETFSLLVWNTHVATEKRLRQLDDEVKAIKHADKIMWDRFQNMLNPAMHISEPLVPVFEELTNVYKKLLELERINGPLGPEQQAHVITLQEHLHHIENEKIDTMNAIVPSSQTQDGRPSIPFGQAVISTLLERCYKTVRKLNCRDSPVEPPSRLLQVNDSLLALLCALERGDIFDPVILRFLAEEVHEIEVAKDAVNGNYIEKDGSVALNQVQIVRDLGLAHQLIHECMHFLEHSPIGTTKQAPDHEKIHALIEKVRDVKDEIQVKIDEGGAFGALDFKPLMEPVKNALVYLEEGLETSFGAASYALSNLLQSTLRLASVALDNVVDPLDATLQPTYDRIQNVFEKLINIRNQHNWEKLTTPPNTKPATAMSKYGDQLQQCDLELQEIAKRRVDGIWIDEKGFDYCSGQDLLDHSFNRANALLRDLLFR